MYPLKQLIKKFSNLPLSISLRNAIGIRPKYYIEPPLNNSVSDLFLWRSDDVWRTRLDLLNLPSVLYPDQNITDKITLIFFDPQGKISTGKR